MKIILTGAGGALGGPVAAALSSAGEALILLGRNPARLPLLPRSWTRAFTLATARPEDFDGGEMLLLLPPTTGPDWVAACQHGIATAAAAGVKALVYLSLAGARLDSPLALSRNQARVEEALISSGLDYTLLRANLLQETLLATFDGQQFSGPAAPVAALARADLVAVLVRVLLDRARGSPAHQRRAYELSGPAALRLAEVAERLAIGYEATAPTDVLQEVWASGQLALPTPTLATLLGRPPQPLAETLATLGGGAGQD